MRLMPELVMRPRSALAPMVAVLRNTWAGSRQGHQGRTSWHTPVHTCLAPRHAHSTHTHLPVQQANVDGLERVLASRQAQRLVQVLRCAQVPGGAAHCRNRAPRSVNAPAAFDRIPTQTGRAAPWGCRCRRQSRWRCPGAARPPTRAAPWGDRPPPATAPGQAGTPAAAPPAACPSSRLHSKSANPREAPRVASCITGRPHGTKRGGGHARHSPPQRTYPCDAAPPPPPRARCRRRRPQPACRRSPGPAPRAPACTASGVRHARLARVMHCNTRAREALQLASSLAHLSTSPASNVTRTMTSEPSARTRVIASRTASSLAFSPAGGGAPTAAAHKIDELARLGGACACRVGGRALPCTRSSDRTTALNTDRAAAPAGACGPS